MGRAPCCDKANVKKGPWSPEEDAKLKSYIEQHGTGGNWIALPQKIGLKRCGKSCRLRWLNYLRPNIRHGGFSEEEDNIICSLYVSIGSRWSIIAAQLPGRTDNDIKNYWNTRLKKKLLGSKQRKDPNAGPSGRRSALKQQQQQQQQHDPLPMSSAGYWPTTTSPMPSMYPTDQAEQHSSIRRLLMKLGGRFPSEPQQAQLPFTTGYNNIAASVSVMAADDVNPLMSVSGFSNPLDDMFADCFYGMAPADMESNGTTSASSTDTGPLLGYGPPPPPMMLTMNAIDGAYQSMQTCLFEEPVQLGTQ